jgi:hypothetical protein
VNGVSLSQNIFTVFLDHGRPQITEAMESKTVDKEELLYMKMVTKGEQGQLTVAPQLMDDFILYSFSYWQSTMV